ncbi:MAG: rhodanese-like domain-containing protein [Bacteroidota bacterium]
MAETLSSSCPIPRWELFKQQLHNVTPTEFEQIVLKHPEYTILDVRTPAEYQEFHLAGARSMDYLGPDFLDQLDALSAEQTYLVYCRSGRRSVRACTLMKNAGITKLIHLDGGINAWTAAKL